MKINVVFPFEIILIFYELCVSCTVPTVPVDSHVCIFRVQLMPLTNSENWPCRIHEEKKNWNPGILQSQCLRCNGSCYRRRVGKGGLKMRYLDDRLNNIYKQALLRYRRPRTLISQQKNSFQKTLWIVKIFMNSVSVESCKVWLEIYFIWQFVQVCEMVLCDQLLSCII